MEDYMDDEIVIGNYVVYGIEMLYGNIDSEKTIHLTDEEKEVCKAFIDSWLEDLRDINTNKK